MGKNLRLYFNEQIGFSKRATCLWCAGLVLILVTAIFNIGIIAIDDYACMISKVIPAQILSFAQVIADRDIRSPFAPMVLLVLSKASFELGIQDPSNQLRFVLVVLSLFSFLTVSGVGISFYKTSVSKKEWFLFLCGFYFLCPLFFSRPMIESISAPLLILSCYYANQYWKKDCLVGLAVSLSFLVLAAMMRFQSGVCFLGILALVLLKRNQRQLAFFVGISLIAFLVTGFLDRLLIGQFHGSLFGYVDYNLRYSSTFGVSPFYTFVLLLLALSLPPTLLSRYKGFDWINEYRDLIPVIFYLSVFVLAHSIVPHKEERFLVPIIPFFLVLLVPLLSFLSVQNPRSWRIRGFVGINLILLPLACFNIPQNNSIGLVRFLYQYPQVKNLVSVGETLVLYPVAFSLKPPELIKISIEDAEQLRGLDCDVAVAIREDYEQHLKKFMNFHESVATFKPGPLEQLLIKLNHKQNLRRGAISLYMDPKCGSKS